MFNRIAVAVADDEIVEQVIATAKQLAGALGARLALVHALDIVAAVAPTTPLGAGIGPVGAGVGPLATQEILEAQEEAGRRFLDRALAALGEAEVLQRDGPPAPAILAAAREWGADLIVIGTHGRSGLGRLALGSVAEGVLREAPCPVLTVRLGMAT
jgi:nucleotide-binding universal stress UspA family protein